MDSVDPGDYLASMMSSAGAGKAQPASNLDLDKQILALAQQAGPAQGSASNQQGDNARAAAAAAQKPQTLHLGFGNEGRGYDTGIPLPASLSNAMVGSGGEMYRLGTSLPFMQQDPLASAVYDQSQTTGAGKTGSMVTDALISAALGGAATQGIGRLGALGAWAVANPFVNAGIQGAVQGAATADPGQRLQGAALSAALSPMLPLVGGAVGKIVQGLTRTPEAQALLDRGVTLPPGMLNSGGLYNKLEQGLTGLPLVGGKISGARSAALPAFTKSVFQDALAPGDTVAGNDLNEMFANAKAGYDNAYSAIKGYPMKAAVVNVKGPDVPLSQAFADVANKPRLGLTASDRASMGQQLQDQLNETIGVAKQSGGMMSDHLQALRSAIRDAARDVSPVDNASRAQQDFWNDAEAQVTKALNSQLPPEVANQLQAIDRQYGGFKIMQSAIAAAKDKPEGPTLQQLSTAIKQATNPTTYAAGGGWNRDAVKAAQSVFGNNVPLTGLTGAGTVTPIMRAVEHTLGGIGVGAGIEGATHLGAVAAHPLGLMGTAAGLGGLWGAYTKPGMAALVGQTGWQQALQRQLGKVSPNAREALGRYVRAGLLSAPLQPQGGLLGSQ